MSKKPTAKDPANEQTITIDGITYNLADLSDEVKQQVANLRVTDAEIERLKVQQAIAQTARNAYAKALSELLPKDGVTKQ